MKILFLSDVLNEISGAGNLSRIHRDALLQLFGKENGGVREAQKDDERSEESEKAGDET